MLQPLSKMYIIVSFYVQQDYIAKNLCEKKDVENNCCHGKCQLKKELAKTDTPISFPALPKSTIELLFSILTDNTDRKTIIFFIKKIVSFPIILFCPNGIKLSVFQPPE